MPMISIRAVGMSFVIEGVESAAIESEKLLERLESTYGVAAAAIRDVEGARKRNDRGTPPIACLIVDRKADSFDAILGQIERWVREQGFGFASWSVDPLVEGAATLHFHRS
jgi:hypothetical protein